MPPKSVVIKHLSKEYKLSHSTGGHATNLAEAIVKTLRKPFERQKSEVFLALDDVNIEINSGDVVGIIGRNGAGKSTLLKVLSRITEPTAGRVEVYGRVGSLLEVGTGFHPELTGLENIYLNGTILGMKRTEIAKQLDAIIEFAGIAKFIDTPVKRYSSGMYVRLAFAVAAHLNPDLLIIDEVLAVGDGEFQKKCLGKLSDVARSGRTVLFVSHNLNIVETLCNQVVFLKTGRVMEHTSDVRGAIQRYVAGDNSDTGCADWRKQDSTFDNNFLSPLRFFVGDRTGNPIRPPMRNDQEAFVYADVNIHELDSALNIGYAIYSESGTLVYWSFMKDARESEWPELIRGELRLKSLFPARLLNEGHYRLEFLSGLHFREWFHEPGYSAPGIDISILGGLSDSPLWMEKRPGILAPVIPWGIH